MAVLAAWPVGEPVRPAVERRLWRVRDRGVLRDTIVIRIDDPLAMLDDAGRARELAELARPLREGLPLRAATERVRRDLDRTPFTHIAEIARLDSVIPEGRTALAGLFIELVDGLTACPGPVAVSMLAGPGESAVDVDDEGEDGEVFARTVEFRLRLAAQRPVPVSLRARAESVCVARTPHVDGWDIAAGPREVRELVEALREQRRGRKPAVPARPLTAAITFALPAGRRDRAAVSGRPVTGALPTDGAALGRVARPSGRMATWRLGWEARGHHVLLAGATGSGKTTTLQRILLDDLEAGRGFVLIDPHGDLATQMRPVLGDLSGTLVVDAGDERSRPLDLLHSDPSVADSIVLSAVHELWPVEFSGPVFQRQVSLAFRLMANAREPLTFGAVDRYFADEAWRGELLRAAAGSDLHGAAVVTLRALKQPAQGDSAVADWVASKFTPLAQGPARHLFDRADSVTWDERVERGDACVLALPTGVLGDGGTRLVGRMLLTRLTRALAARRARDAGDRRPFSVVIDEAHLLAGPALGALFAQVRKFGGSVIVATQVPHQLEPHLDLILSNVQTVITGRLTQRSASVLLDRAGRETVSMLPALPRRHLAVIGEDHDPECSPVVLSPIRLPDPKGAAAAVARRASALPQDPPARGAGGAEFLTEWLERRRGAAEPALQH